MALILLRMKQMSNFLPGPQAAYTISQLVPNVPLENHLFHPCGALLFPKGQALTPWYLEILQRSGISQLLAFPDAKGANVFFASRAYRSEKLDRAPAGSTLAKQVHDPEGNLLGRENDALSDNLKRFLAQRGVTEVMVKNSAGYTLELHTLDHFWQLLHQPSAGAAGKPAGAPGDLAVPHPGRPYILTADDSVATNAILTKVLETAGYEVKSVLRSEELFEQLGHRVPDLIILDTMIPRVDGFSVLRALKANPCLKHTPILVCSARSDRPSVIHALSLGAADYIVKPFTSEIVVAKVKAALDAMKRQT